MDVRLSPEQRALQDTAIQLVDRLRPQAVKELSDQERAAKLDAAVAASGWRELRAAGDDGAPWSSAVEVALVAEQLGRGLADVAFVGPVLAADLRRLAGEPPASNAETVGFAADLSAPGAEVGFDAAGATTALVATSEGGTLQLGTVALRDGASDGDGGVDLTRAIVPLTSDAVVPLSKPEISEDGLSRWIALGLATACADLVGVMAGTTALARDYAVVRKQFGATIGSFQAVQHLLADAFVVTEGSRSIALHAAWAVDALEPRDALAAAAAAKAYCARAAQSVCETSIQVHGGIGNTWDCLAHVYLRRALVSIDLLGGIGPSLARVLECHELR